MTKQTLQSDTEEKLHNETAQIAWVELQRFFAQGSVLLVEDELDLVEVAANFAMDQTKELESLIENGLIAPPSNDKAREWYNADVKLWSVVVAPFVLVQEQR